jgi:hypothetical protein
MFWPVPGMGLSFADGFVVGLRDMLRSIASNTPATPSFLDGMRANEVVAASQASAQARAWQNVDLVRA